MRSVSHFCEVFRMSCGTSHTFAKSSARHAGRFTLLRSLPHAMRDVSHFCEAFRTPCGASHTFAKSSARRAERFALLRNLLLHMAEHPVNAPPLLFHAGMHVEIHSCRHVSMAEQSRHRLVVAPAFYAAGGKGVAQTVEFQSGQACPPHLCEIVAAILMRL